MRLTTASLLFSFSIISTACNNGKGDSLEEGSVNGVTATCSADFCTLRANLTLVDLEGEPVQDGLEGDDFRLSITMTAKESSEESGSPEVESADVVSVDARIRESDTSRSVVLVDQSGSTDSSDPDDFRFDATETFINEVITDDSEDSSLAVMSFPRENEMGDYGFSETDTWQYYTNDREALLSAVEAMRYGYKGGTPLYDSMYEVMSDLESPLGIDDPAETAMVVLTDGDDSGSYDYNAEDVINLATDTGTALYIVGLGYEINVDALRQLADSTGGFYLTAEAEQIEEVFTGFAQAIYDSVSITIEVDMTEDSSPIEAGQWYIIEGTIEVQGLEIEVKEDVYIDQLETSR